MIRFAEKKHRPIGLDIGYNSIKMIQLAGTGESLRVVDAGQVPFSHDVQDSEDRAQFAAEAIKEMLANGRFQGRDVVSCLSNDSIKIKSLRLDTAEQEEIEAMLKNEIPKRFNLDPSVDELRYLVAGSVHQGEEIKNEVIFFGADRQIIASHLSMLKDAGVNPVSLDTVPCSLYRCFQRSMRRQEDRNAVSVFVDTGFHYTTVAIGRGQELCFIKQIPVAGKHINDEVAEKLDVSFTEASALRAKLRNSDAEDIDPATRQAVADAVKHIVDDIAREISLCFRYFAVTFRGDSPEQAIFSGGEAYEQSLLDALAGHLSIDIKRAQPLLGFDLGESSFVLDSRSELCEWTVAVGLGMKGWDMSDCRSDEYARN